LFVSSLIVNYLTAYITQFHLISFIKQTEHTYTFQLGGKKEKEKKQNMEQKNSIMSFIIALLSSSEVTFQTTRMLNVIKPVLD